MFIEVNKGTIVFFSALESITVEENNIAIRTVSGKEHKKKNKIKNPWRKP